MIAAFGKSEALSLSLRELYRSYGYRQYKVGEFEEYDLYARNRNFLTGEHILTFSDTDGRLLALKPDVTLSIIKNTREDDRIRKVWYTENVYRVPRNADGFQEILQTGLECIGTVDLYTMAEVLMLAAGSLNLITPDYVLDLSHLGVLTGVLEAAAVSEALRPRLLAAVGEKNLHALRALCREGCVEPGASALLEALCPLGGPMEDTLPKLSALPLPAESRAAAEEIARVWEILQVFGDHRVNLDLSVVSDTDYYNGLVFRGFVDGVAAPVLSGGRYDNLLNRMGKTGGAIGFAVYLSELERFLSEAGGPDLDVLLTYGPKTDPAAVAKRARALTAAGSSVRVQPRGEAAVTYRRREDLSEEDSLCREC